MKKLRNFNIFDAVGFFKDKDVRVMSHEDWKEYDEDGKNSKIIGTKYKTVIAADRPEYTGGDVAPDLNAGEQVIVKVPKPPKEYKKFSKIVFVNSKVAFYSTFMSSLSVDSEDTNINPPK